MIVKAIGFGLHQPDRNLITNMVSSILQISNDQIEITDAECYQPSIGSETVIFAYGTRAHKRLLASIEKHQQPWIVILPDVHNLKKDIANKIHRQKAVEILRKVKQQIDEKQKGNLEKTEQSNFSMNSLKITLKNGQEIIVADHEGADALPNEIKTFLHLLDKLPYQEVDIEFIKNDRRTSS